MKVQRFWKLSLVLVLLLVSGQAASVSALPDADVSTPAQVDAAAGEAAALAGDVHIAASCSREHVQAAVDDASDGDFVLVPAGQCEWATPPPGDASAPAILIDGKGITLQGAGIGQTVITDTTGTGWNNSLVRVNGVEGKPFRITGFTFTEVNRPSAMGIYGTNRGFRVDHNEFENRTATSCVSAINFSGYTYGVVDHSTFTNTRILVTGDGDAAWQRPLSLGSANAVYVEDSSFAATVHCNTVDASHGGRYVFRHNQVDSAHMEGHTCNNVGMRGTFSYEIYENTFTGAHYAPFHMRAGTGVVFSNTIAGPYGNSNIYVDNRRSCEAPCQDGPVPWNRCDGNQPMDGNQPGGYGYPCRDQIGRSTDTGFYTTQALEPLYEWNNWDTYAGTDVDIVLNPAMCLTMTYHIQENRDYYNDTPRPGYTPYAYPHPLTQDLVLTGTPANEGIQLDWDVAAWTYLPPTSTWRITFYSETVPSPVVRTGIVSPTRAYTLTGLTNFEWYTITVNATLDTTPILTDTVRVMPTDLFVHLPLVRREVGD
jgi:hypothetical protein